MRPRPRTTTTATRRGPIPDHAEILIRCVAIPVGGFLLTRLATLLISRYVVDLSVPYEHDLDHAAAIVRRVGEEMRAEPSYASVIMAPVTILGVDTFADSGVNLRLYLQTRPGRQHAENGVAAPAS